MSYLDFAEIKASNPIEQVAERLGLKLKKTGKQLRGACPSGEGGERALVITPSKGLWYSFALERGGDVLALIQLVNDCTTKEAAAFLSHEPLEKAKKPPKRAKQPAEGAERGFRALTYLKPDHEAVAALGFELEDAERLGIGYAPRGLMRGQVAIPIRTDRGDIAGYIGVIEAKLPPKWRL